LLSNRSSLIKLATWASVFVAIILIFAKFFAWIRTDSISLQATLVDSVLDAMASLINFFAVRQSLKPADSEHRFGHGKIEALSSLFQSAFIAGSALWLLIESTRHFTDNSIVTEPELGLWTMLFSIVLTLALVLFQRYVIKSTQSMAIKADAAHYVGDILVNIAVVFALMASHFSLPAFIDPLIGCCIAIYICFAAWKISKEAIDMLVDRELPDNIRETIINTILKRDFVKGFHDLRTRLAGPKEFIQFHLELDGDLSLKDAHMLSDQVMNDIKDRFPQAEVLIHEDVYKGKDEKT
jgi:ferrous-iron efflux pump FieF